MGQKTDFSEAEEKQDESSIPMTIIPDPEEKAAIEEAVKTLRSSEEDDQIVQKELSVEEENKEDSSIPTAEEEKSAIEEAVKTLRADPEEAAPEIADEKLPGEAEQVKEAISSAVETINKESVEVTESGKLEAKDEEPKVEESYQKSDPK